MKDGLQPDNVFLKRLGEDDDVIDVHQAGFLSQPFSTKSINLWNTLGELAKPKLKTLNL